MYIKIETPDGQLHEIKEPSVWRVEDMVKRMVNTYRNLNERDRAYAIASELYAYAHIGASRRRSVDPEGLRALCWKASEDWYDEHIRLGGKGDPFYPPTYNQPRISWEELFREID